MTTDGTHRTGEPPAGAPPRRLPLVIAAAAVAAATGVGLFYGMGGFPRKVADAPTCRPAVETASRLKPLMRGEVAAVLPATAARAIPDLAFTDGAGAARRLSDFRGRWLLVNLWATWCVSCRVEMPALDALQAAFGGDRFEVLAIDLDTRNPERARAFLAEIGVRHLNFYADHSAQILRDLGTIGLVAGLPTTLLIDPLGCEIAHMSGSAAWASEDARALIRAAVGG